MASGGGAVEVAGTLERSSGSAASQHQQQALIPAALGLGWSWSSEQPMREQISYPDGLCHPLTSRIQNIPQDHPTLICIEVIDGSGGRERDGGDQENILNRSRKLRAV